MKCWYKLKIDVENALQPDWKLPEIYNKQYGWWMFYDVENIFTKEWLDTMSSVGLVVTHCVFFYRGVDLNQPDPHIDGDGKDPPGLNWAIGGKDSKMIWYETPKVPAQVGYTASNTTYLTWPAVQLTEIERYHINNELTMVHVNLPHTIVMGDEPRWCISVRVRSLNGLDWEEVTEYMRSRNLLIEE